MGISTYQSYCGAQIFEAVGLSRAFVDEYFFGTATSIEGIGLSEIAEETFRRHAAAFGDAGSADLARRRRRISLSGSRRSAQLDAADGLAAAARRSRLRARPRLCFRQAINEQGKQHDDDPRPVPRQVRQRTTRPFRSTMSSPRRRSSSASRPAPCVRLDLARGPRHARHRDEPHRRQVEHRRRRRGRRPLQADGQWRFAAQRDQAGRLRPLRGDHRISGERRPIQIKMAQGAKPGEGGQLPGHKVMRSSPRCAIRPQGVGLDLAAAAPRHLLDRGSGAAHPRSEERQSAGARFRSSSSPRSASARSPRASPRARPTTSPSPASTAAPAHRRYPRSSTPARLGSWASPRRIRRWC